MYANREAPAPTPMAPMALTDPEAGVIATSPATAPVITPRSVGFESRIQSIRPQAQAAAAVATWVTTKALAAEPSAATALPALKPNQPNQSKPVPSTAKGRLCGGDVWFGCPLRRPRTIAATRAETPALMWTTVPPAKSRAPSPKPKKPPPLPHTQWQTGA